MEKKRLAKLTLTIVIFSYFFLFCPLVYSQVNEIQHSVVKIITTSQQPDYYTPWRMKKISTQNGTGFIIDGERIMTNAHVVANAKYIIIQKNNDPKRYTAKIQHIGNDCDLAVLKVIDKDFFKNTTPLDFGGIPNINDTVLAYGYPVGGEKASVTKGIVSRIDYIRYSHSGIDYHLAIQVDAAINPGNSGGPITKDGKVVGVAFQSLMWAQNSSYMIPYPVIERFLRDISDEKYDGYIELGFYYQELENKALQEHYELPENKTGVVISSLFMDNAKKILKPGDILLSIDGYKIANDASITIWNERLPLTEAAEIKLAGEKIAVTFVRDGKILNNKIVLMRFVPKIELANKYNEEPEFIVFAGLVFMPLSREYIKTWGNKWYDEANKKLLYYYFYYVPDEIYKDNPYPIVLCKRLPDPVNTYCEDYEDLIITSVNGKKMNSLREMRDLKNNIKEGFIVIEFENDVSPIVLKAENIHDADQRIMKRYNINKMENLKE